MSNFAAFTLQTSSCVNHSLAGNFSSAGAEEVAVFRANVVTLYRFKPSPSGTALWQVVEEKLFATPHSVVKFRAPGHSTDSIAICFSESHLSVLQYDPGTYTFRTVSLHHLGERSIPAEPCALPPILRVNPKGTMMTLLVRRRYLFFLPMGKNIDQPKAKDDDWGDEEPEESETQQQPEASSETPITTYRFVDLMEDPKTPLNGIRDMVLLEGEDPTVLFLVETESSWAGRVKLRRIETGEMLSKYLSCAAVCMSFQFAKQSENNVSGMKCQDMWTADGLPYNANRLTSVDNGFSGALCFSSNTVVHLRPEGSSGFYLNKQGQEEVQSQQTLIQWFPLGWFKDTRPKSTHSLTFDDIIAAGISSDQFIVADRSSGFLFWMSLRMDKRATHKVELRLRGRSNPPSCFATITSTALFVGSETGDSVLLQINPKDPAGELRTLDSLMSVGPMVDAAIIDSMATDTELAKSVGTAPGAKKTPFVNFEPSDVQGAAFSKDPLPSIGRQLSGMQLVAAVGHGKTGALCLQNRSLTLQRVGDRPVDCVAVFAITPPSRGNKRGRDDTARNSPTTHILLSNVTSTIVFVVKDRLVQERTGFIGDERTVAASALHAAPSAVYSVQVTVSKVAVLENAATIVSGISVADDPKESGEPLFVRSALISATKSRVYTVLSNNELWIVDIAFDGSRCEVSKKRALENVSCITLSDDEAVLYVVSGENLSLVDSTSGETILVVEKFTALPTLIRGSEVKTLRPVGQYRKGIRYPQISEMILSTTENRTRLYCLTSSGEFVVYRFEDGSKPFVPLALVKEHHDLHATTRLSDHFETIEAKKAAKQGDTTSSSLTSEMKGKTAHLYRFENLGSKAGVYVCGRQPKICYSHRGALRVYEHNLDSTVRGFAPVEGDGAVIHQGAVLCAEGKVMFVTRPAADFNYDPQWPTRKIRLDATPHFVASFPEDHSVVACVSEPKPFRPTRPPFDAELDMKGSGQVSHPDHRPVSLDEGIPIPMQDRYTLKLLHANTWDLHDSVQLLENEVVLSCKEVSIRGPAAHGSKPTSVLAVGTSFPLGEDTPCRGRIILFGIQLSETTAAQRNLVQLCERSTKGPVTAMSSMQEMLVATIGATVNVYSFDWGEQSLNVKAFYYSSTYITSISSLKNYLLLSDLYNSISLVRWREENNSLTCIAKDPHKVATMAAEFVYSDGEIALIAADDERNVAAYEYSVRKNLKETAVLESNLTATADFRIRSPISKFIRLRVPNGNRNGLLDKAVALYITFDGEIGVIRPLNETWSRSLQYLTERLCSDIPHQAGLHPKYFTAAMRDDIRSVAKDRMIDGLLCDRFVQQSVPDRATIATAVGSKDERVLGILAALHDECRFF